MAEIKQEVEDITFLEGMIKIIYQLQFPEISSNAIIRANRMIYPSDHPNLVQNIHAFWRFEKRQDS